MVVVRLPLVYKWAGAEYGCIAWVSVRRGVGVKVHNYRYTRNCIICLISLLFRVYAFLISVNRLETLDQCTNFSKIRVHLLGADPKVELWTGLSTVGNGSCRRPRDATNCQLQALCNNQHKSCLPSLVKSCSSSRLVVYSFLS